MENQYKVTYTFKVDYANVELDGEPRNSVTTFVFDGTDAHIDVVIKQFETFLKAAGYSFDCLELVKL